LLLLIDWIFYIIKIGVTECVEMFALIIEIRK